MGEMQFNGEMTVSIGETLPSLTKYVTQEMINKWAEVSGDFNPLHVDPKYGKATFFRTNIAHGPLTLSFIIEMLTRCFGKHWVSGGRLYEVRLIAPVPPGTAITIGGEIINVNRKEDSKNVECDIFVKNQEQKVIVTGKASCQF
jgi:3-hydroxybutyryl-CoA dehydratase